MHESQVNRRMTLPVGAALAGVLMGVVAGLFLVFSPVYQGVSETATSSGGVVSGTYSATLVEQNGAWVLLLLCLPVALAAIGLVGAARRRRLLVWAPAVVLLGFSVLAGFSIGLFYVPAAAALLLAAVTVQRPGETRRRSDPTPPR